MEEYCRRTHSEALAKLNDLDQSYRYRREFFNPILSKCKADWTDGSGIPNNRMIAYCVEKELQSASRMGVVPTERDYASPNIKFVDPNTVEPDPNIRKDQVTRLTVTAFMATWRRFVGHSVILLDARINSASVSEIQITGGGHLIRGLPPWLSIDDMAYVITTCGSGGRDAECTIPVGGIVRKAPGVNAPELTTIGFAR